MLTLRLDTRGVHELLNKFSGLERDLHDLGPLWRRVKVIVNRYMTERFASGGDGTWAPLTAAYAARKARIFPGQPLLVASGELRTAATNPKVNTSGSIMRISITDPVAEFHQHGTSRMVARPLIPDVWPFSVQALLTDASDEFVNEALARRALGGRMR